MAKSIENLVKAIREKLGVDVPEEVQKAWLLDMDALRQGVATKADDERLAQLVKDVTEIKATLAGLNIAEAVKAALPKVDPATLEAVEVKTPKDITDFIAASTTSMATLQTAVNAMLEKLAQMPAPAQKSDQKLPGVDRNSLTQELIAALKGTQQKSDDAAKDMFPMSAIRWNE